jgi:hypothetical protein
MAPEVGAVQKRRDCGRGTLSPFIERTVMIREPRLSPAGFRVTHDGEILHDLRARGEAEKK